MNNYKSCKWRVEWEEGGLIESEACSFLMEEKRDLSSCIMFVSFHDSSNMVS